MSLKEILITTLLPVIKSVGIIELSEVLTNLKKDLPAGIEFADVLRAINSNFSLLQTVAKKTKTKIDDGLIDAVLESVRLVANDNGIAL